MTLKLKEMHFCSFLAHHSQWIDENWVKGRMWQDPEEHLMKGDLDLGSRSHKVKVTIHATFTEML